MHIAASNPLAINKDDISKDIVEKELEIIKAEITNSGKPADMVDKISKGKISKFLNDNSLLNQMWIMDPKKKVLDILKEHSKDMEIKIVDFVKYKVGEGV
jgi:elongation factor Ts